MDKKLELKTGSMHQLYIAVIASIGAIILFAIFIILAAVSNDMKTITEALIIMACVEGIIWIIFFIIRVIFRTKLTVAEKGFVMKRWNKVLWEMDWSEIEKIEYFVMSCNFFLTLNFHAGNLLLTRTSTEIRSTETCSKQKRLKRERTAVLFQKDVKKIANTFNRDITIKSIE